MEEDKQIQVTGPDDDSTQPHQNAPPLATENNKNDDECSFGISNIQLSNNDHDESPLDDVEETSDLPIMPLASPWLRGIQSPDRSFGSPKVPSPVTKYRPTSMEDTSSELSNFDASILAKKILALDKSALDASAVTNTLMESSFTGPDATNSRLEAAYMWKKREDISLLQKIKDHEEAIVQREQAKLDRMMSVVDCGSPLKWAKDMIGETPDAGFPRESMSYMDGTKMPPKLDRMTKLPSQLYPTKLNESALPTTTISTKLKTNGSSNLEEAADTTTIEKRTGPSLLRRMMLLLLLPFVCTILSVHRARIEYVLKAVMSQAAPMPTQETGACVVPHIYSTQ